MNSREQFEREATGRRLDVSMVDGFYVDPTTHLSWSVWQASRACATPEWEHAPDWANWLAMDVEGRWYWFAEKPEQRLATWGNVWNSRVAEAGWTLGRSGWTETLEPRP